MQKNWSAWSGKEGKSESSWRMDRQWSSQFWCKSAAVYYVIAEKIFDHKETVDHEAAIKLLIEGEKMTLDNLYLKTLPH